MPTQAEPAPAGHEATKEKRRWGLTVLILVMAAGAAATRMATRRR
jgi:hypothetical protein